MSESITPWIHIVAVTMWLGPQFFMFLATAPALRLIEDPQLRLRVVRVITTRFNHLAWIAMAVIVLSGISNLSQVANDFDHVFDTDYRYFQIFSTKMVLVGLAVLFTALHTKVVGPRLLQLQEEMASEEAEIARLRRSSIIFSSLGLLATVAVIFAAALLGNHEYSFQLV
jgi:uncharacterized membrane protein